MKLTEKIIKPVITLTLTELANAVEEYTRKHCPEFRGSVLPQMPDYKTNGLLQESSYSFEVISPK